MSSIVSHAQPTDGKDITPDSIHISLLTCSPHQEVYSLYGHTAIRYQDKSRNIDVAVNYGMFNFHKSFFVLRFVFGLTDYEMGIVPYPYFEEEYMSYGSEVCQQEINLTAEEKIIIAQALEENAKPENKVYRYNYFYDNCTTRARDMIIDHIKGKVNYNTKVPEGLTFRDMIHMKNADHPWARLGNDMLLGVKADRQLTLSEMQFLPDATMNSFDNAIIIRESKKAEKLVKEKSIIIEGQPQKVEREFILTPWQMSILLTLIIIVFTAKELYTKHIIWGLDILLLTLQGLCGLILTAMIFSAHPTVSLNIQILLFNPLPLIFGWQMIRQVRKGEKCHWMWKMQAGMIVMMQILEICQLQWIDPAIMLLASSLLFRNVTKAYICR